MALSKRICEMMLTSGIMPPETQTHFIILRFGNVLGSSGSVIPVFGQQIADGGPVTVTHPEISRHFMTIPEACELILEAGFMGKSGEIYFFDMGEPVRISDMAGKMIRLSGLEPGKDIEIAYTGLRPGEKLEEEVICDKEHTMPTTNPKIRLIQRKNEYYPGILPRIDNILKKLYSFSKEEIIGIMKDMLKNNELTVDR
jgi:FlaA1/EpsC-like NDP-sugar epimerase